MFGSISWLKSRPNAKEVKEDGRVFGSIGWLNNASNVKDVKEDGRFSIDPSYPKSSLRLSG